MAHVKVHDDVLLPRITEVFRTLGFSGASLSEFERATGLKKASLYYRFPGGKEEMAEAVLQFVHADLIRSLRGLNSQGPSLARAERVAVLRQGLNAFYNGGCLPCLTDAMSLGSNGARCAAALKALVSAVLEQFTEFARQAGLAPAAAARWALTSQALLQGALVLARALEQPSIFQQVVDELGQDLPDGQVSPSPSLSPERPPAQQSDRPTETQT